MVVPLLLLFIVVPIAELYVIIQVGEAIGALPTIAILVADSVLGTWLLRSQGRATWRNFNAALAAGRPPAREVLDGALVIFGGAFLITPGFITDLIGVVLLLPPSRALVRRTLVRNFTNRAVVRVFGRPGRPGRPGPARPASYDVEGTGVEIDPPLPRRR
jgi:UPF0716 protein FxsA